MALQLEAPYRKDIPKFFLEMVTHWLVPGEEVIISRFQVTRIDGKIVCEAEVEGEGMEENFPLWEEEIKLGLRSPYHAKRLLELKGLFLEAKESFIQEAIRERVFKYPEHFDYDIFPWMQKFVVSWSEEYKNSHSYQTLARVISNSYLLWRKVVEEESPPDERNFILKLIPMQRSTPFGEKLTIGCFVVMNFLKDNEILEDKHLIRAVRKYCPDAVLVEGSYFVHEDDNGLLFYLELEREESFTSEEIALLKGELKDQVKGSIENLVRPVFMPRNEEEVMKYMVTLSKQVTTLRDLPQIVVLFNEQTDDDLIFTLVIVRPLCGAPIEEMLEESPFDVQIEKVRVAGYIRKRIAKEATQMRVSMGKGEFLRDDFVVDLYKARQTIVSWLESSLGKVRDYNGGMIAKQMEIFSTFRDSLPDADEHMLSNFFHALYPIELRGAFPLKQFYLMFQTFLEENKELLLVEEKNVVYVCVKGSRTDTPPFRLLQLHITIQEKIITGYALFPESEEEKKIFYEWAERMT